MENLTQVSSNLCFGGVQKVYSHFSEELKCEMKFAIFLPPQTTPEDKFPVVYWLSGLTCNEQNFITKSGAQRYASNLGLIIVCPDTSPRNLNLPGDKDSWDFGEGAGFYLNAEVEPWKSHYRMYNYVNEELHNLVMNAFSQAEHCKVGIMGHSMGGHGALISALKKPGRYKSVSVFAPICHPMECPWGVKAFTGYLGPREQASWNDWDAVELVKKYIEPPLQIFIDQGTSDQFYIEKQLQPEIFMDACRKAGVSCIFKLREGFDHSYYYIATYIGEHLEYHAKILKNCTDFPTL